MSATTATPTASSGKRPASSKPPGATEEKKKSKDVSTTRPVMASKVPRDFTKRPDGKLEETKQKKSTTATVATQNSDNGLAEGDAELKKKKRRLHPYPFLTSIGKINKEVNGNSVGMKSDSVFVLNDITKYLVERLSKNIVDRLTCKDIYKKGNNSSVKLTDVQSAVRLEFPEQLALHAISEMAKSIAKHSHYGDRNADASAGAASSSSEVNDESKTSNGKTKPVLDTVKAGLDLSVTRVESILRKFFLNRKLSTDARIAFPACVEYILAEILESSAEQTRVNKKQRITPQFIWNAIEMDEELNELFKDLIFNNVRRNVKLLEESLKKRKSPSKKRAREEEGGDEDGGEEENNGVAEEAPAPKKKKAKLSETVETED